MSKKRKAKEEPWFKCRWIKVKYKCRSPANEGETFPGGCDAQCPARIQFERKSEKREKESKGVMYQ